MSFSVPPPQFPGFQPEPCYTASYFQCAAGCVHLSSTRVTLMNTEAQSLLKS